MGIPICRHVKIGGGRCGSPALRGQHYCYFHAGAHRTVPSVNLYSNQRKNGGGCGPRPSWPDPEACILRQDEDSLEDAAHRRNRSLSGRTFELSGKAAAVQLGFTRLIRGVAQGLLSKRQAKLILRELHQAANRWDGTATEDSAVTSNRLTFTIKGQG
jgi:hypothetical protein